MVQVDRTRPFSINVLSAFKVKSAGIKKTREKVPCRCHLQELNTCS